MGQLVNRRSTSHRVTDQEVQDTEIEYIPQHGPVSPRDHFNQWWLVTSGPTRKEGRTWADQDKLFLCVWRRGRTEQTIPSGNFFLTGNFSSACWLEEKEVKMANDAYLNLNLFTWTWNPLIIPSFPPLQQKEKAKALKVAHFFFLHDWTWCLTWASSSIYILETQATAKHSVGIHLIPKQH